MSELCRLIWHAFVGLFRSRAALEAEILVLRHQLNVLRRKSPRRMPFSGLDRAMFAGLYALAPTILNALHIVKPETVVPWHRAGGRRGIPKRDPEMARKRKKQILLLPPDREIGGRRQKLSL